MLILTEYGCMHIVRNECEFLLVMISCVFIKKFILFKVDYVSG